MKKKGTVRKPLLPMSSRGRSIVTNGRQLFVREFDQRSSWYRRFTDLLHLHINDLGGPTNVSEAERSLVRRAVTITTQLEYLETQFAEVNDRIEKGEDVSVPH